MTTELARTNGNAAGVMERVIALGDLSKLEPAERVRYYREVCDSLALNWLTKPFDYLHLNNKLTLYATRAAADQLRRRDAVSIDKPDVRFEEGLCIVSVTARTSDGRTDSELGVVAVEGLKGDARANAILKAITKAKRRVTLSIVGLGWLDETEVDTIRDARRVAVDVRTGEAAEEMSTANARTVTAEVVAESVDATPEPPSGTLTPEQREDLIGQWRGLLPEAEQRRVRGWEDAKKVDPKTLTDSVLERTVAKLAKLIGEDREAPF